MPLHNHPWWKWQCSSGKGALLPSLSPSSSQHVGHWWTETSPEQPALQRDRLVSYRPPSCGVSFLEITMCSTSLIFLVYFSKWFKPLLLYYKYSISINFSWLAACLWFYFLFHLQEWKIYWNFSFGLCVFAAYLEHPSHQNKHYFLICPVNLYFITYWIHFCMWLEIKLINCFHMMESHYTVTWFPFSSLI